jgi:putative mRNA 3-end processing factor
LRSGTDNFMKKQGIIKLTDSGLYCEQGDFYIDPWLPVKKAILTHAHADHTYRGNQDYLVPEEGVRLSRIRLGDEAKISTAKYGATTDINGVKVSFHPAGHVLGSAQVRVEYQRRNLGRFRRL